MRGLTSLQLPVCFEVVDGVGEAGGGGDYRETEGKFGRFWKLSMW